VASTRFAHLADCFGCGRANPGGLGLHLDADADHAWCRTSFGAQHQGAPGLVHGGLLVTLLDEVMGSLPMQGPGVRVTKSMAVRFRRPVRIDRDLDAVATVQARDGRNVTIEGVVRYADHDDVRVEVTAEYVVLDAIAAP
jgi:acyl-coenzyme A thioesterase PaaI-like protein